MSEDQSSFERLCNPETHADEIARLEADREARDKDREVRLDIAYRELERQDDDYHALEFRISFTADVLCLDCDESLTEDMRVELSTLSEDDDLNARMVEMLIGEINATIKPWSEHFRQMGLVRADNLIGVWVDGERGDCTAGPVFYLVYHAAHAALRPEVLAEFEVREIGMQVTAGAKLAISAVTLPFNATILFKRDRQVS